MIDGRSGRCATALGIAVCLLWSGAALGVAKEAKEAAGDVAESKSFEASDGTRIHYLEKGRGTPVLLIHGYTGSARGNWFSNGVADALAATNRVVAIDVRGHGESDKPHTAAAYGARIWQDAIELLDYLGIERAHVHGYSMGGAITTQLLAHAPERFITASYGGSGVRETDPEWTSKVAEDTAGTDPLEAEARSTLRASPTRDDIALGFVRETWRDAFSADLDLASLDLPVLAINGEYDSPNAKTSRLRRELRHFKSVVLPGKSHLTAIMAGYIPDLYIDSLVDFVRRHEPVAADPRVRDAIALLETWVETERAMQEIPGLSMAVVADQELVWSAGFGHAHREKEIPATPSTIYSICSISKLFTSVGVMQQRDAGRLRLDDPVERHLDWFDLSQVHHGSPEITIEGLLTHSSGLPRESDHPYWTGPEFEFPDRQAIIDGLANQETLYPAARTFQYSNLGLTLAGEVISAVAGASFDGYIDAHILRPLDLDDTTTEIPKELAGGQLATGYGRRLRSGERAPVELFEARGIAPAAGFASTVNDLAKFASWQLRLLETGGDEVLEANTLREMHRVHWLEADWSTSWGLGFAVRRDGDRTIVGHGGSCPGFRSELSIDPAAGVAVAFASNAMGVNTRSFVERAHDVLGSAIESARQSPMTRAEDEASEDELESYVGVYESAWGETAIVRWQGGLAAVPLPTRDPKRSLRELRHVEGHTFKRVRSDGDLGEAVVFEVDDAGEVVSFSQHGNHSMKVR